jgi:IMP dehydrogenase
MIIKEALAFDDVLLVPCYTEVRSRSIPDLTSHVAGLRLKTPIISSPMDTVTEADMAIVLGKMGGMGIIHRFMSPAEQIDNLRAIEREERSSESTIPKVFAIGVGKEELSRFKEVYHSVPVDAVAIDVANGHSSYMRDMIHQVRDIAPDIQIIAGNVATGEGFMHLAESGANAVRVGIGGGSICKTRIQTSFGVPTLHSIMEAYYVKQRNPHFQNVAIIADGGIRYPGDFVKSIAAGADAIMCGRILAQTEESPGTPVWDNNAGIMTKTYRGMASSEVQQDKRGGLKPMTCAEGVSTTLPIIGSAKSVIEEFAGGLRSGMTYANATNLAQLRSNATFIKITSAGLSESHAFGTRKE